MFFNLTNWVDIFLKKLEFFGNIECILILNRLLSINLTAKFNLVFVGWFLYFVFLLFLSSCFVFSAGLNIYLINYFKIFLISQILIIVFSIVLIVTKLLGNKEYESELVSTYECGFMPFEDARIKFDVKFYLVAVMYVIFDLEIVLIFPWVLVLNIVSLFSFYSMILFLVILIIGFMYEWNYGILDWYINKKNNYDENK